MKKQDKYYAAMRARDPRFDGKFFVGVKTTGIYCRPICPARPKRENIEFFSDKRSAERAGYRACLRCRPETTPHSGAWLGKSAMVKRAVKIIETGSLGSDENKFADKFGVSARHLRRVFKEQLGRTPKQLAFERRLQKAHGLVIRTHKPMTEIAYAAGFASVRRFNDAFKIYFRKTPTQVRRGTG